VRARDLSSPSRNFGMQYLTNAIEMDDHAAHLLFAGDV
jgi:hypothetical protein